MARIDSPAKINLGLEILGKRADGFHEIRTVLQMISLVDEIEVTPATRSSLTCSDEVIDPGENLAFRASRLWSDRLDPFHRAAHVTLVKHIPVAAGLGGASGNAASTLLALNTLYDVRPDSGLQQQLAAELGSDVPFFLTGPASLASGRGEVLTPILPIDDRIIVLVTPGLAIPSKTATMYRALDPATDFTDGSVVVEGVDLIATRRALEERHLFNAFERPLVRLFPELESIAAVMRSCFGVLVGLSGAGPTWYALADSQAAADELVVRVANGFPSARIVTARPLSRRPPPIMVPSA